MTFRNRLPFFFITALGVTLLAAVFYGESMIKEELRVVNLAGKQRMLSQRVALFSKEYMERRDADARRRLAQVLDDYKENADYLLSVPRYAFTLQSLTAGGKPASTVLLAYHRAGLRLLESPSIETLQPINAVREELLDALNNAVYWYEGQVREKQERTHLLKFGFSVTFALLLALFYWLVIRPQREVARSKAVLEQAQRVARLGSWEWEIESGRLAWSDEIFRIFGLDPETTRPTYEAFLKTIHPEDRQAVEKEIHDALVLELPYAVDHRIVRPGGEIRYVHEEGHVSRSRNGKPQIMIGTVQDVTEMRKAREELERLNRRLNRYIQMVDRNVITSETDLKGTITYVSEAFCAISGYSLEELIGRSHNIVRHPEMPKEIYREMWGAIHMGGTWQGEIKNRKKDGGYYWVDVTISPRYDDAGNMAGYTAVRQDITDKKRIEELSVTDELTGLYNRRHFNHLFPQEINRARREEKPFAFIILDVDNFKKYNDTYGHGEGDRVLKAVAGALKSIFKRQGDEAFRLGGEEFGAILQVTHPEDAAAMAEAARAAIQALGIPHEKNTAAPVVTASFGMAILPFHETPTIPVEIETLYTKADEALYRAKDGGRNRVVAV